MPAGSCGKMRNGGTMNRIVLTGNVLWIENDRDVREVVTLLLSNHGAIVQPYGDGHKALEVFSSDVVDVVLTDYMMPAINGVQVLHRIREIDPHTPVILITAIPEREALAASLGDEVFAVLPKPFSVPILLETIDRGIRHKRRLKVEENKERLPEGEH